MLSGVHKRLQLSSETTGEEAASSQKQERPVKACDQIEDCGCRENSPSTGNGRIGRGEDESHSEMSESATFGFKHCEIPEVFQIPFIVSGYRRPDLSFWECIKGLLRSSNETFNVWSHLVALVLFISVNMTSLTTDDPFSLPLISFAIGISVLYFTSSSAHLFNCMSADSHRICFFFDYAAIGFYTFTAGQALFFYSRAAGAPFWSMFDSLVIFQILSSIFSFLLTIFCCISSHPRWKNHKALLKVAVLVINWLVITSPYTIRMLLCKDDPAYNCVSSVYFMRHIIFCGLGAVLYAARLPERLMIGVFDNFGQSHNLQHILVAMGIQQAFNTAQVDLHGRRAVLAARFASQPTLMNTVGAAIIVLIGHVAIVLWFARKLFSAKNKRQ